MSNVQSMGGSTLPYSQLRHVQSVGEERADAPKHSVPVSSAHPAEFRRLAAMLGVYIAFIVITFSLYVDYPDATFGIHDDVQYVFYLDVTVMMLVARLGMIIYYDCHDESTHKTLPAHHCKM